MTNLNEYLTAGRKALQQWRPQWEAAINRAQTASSNQLATPKLAGREPGVYSPPALGDLLEQNTNLPPFSLLLGLGEDKLPFHLDLTNPASGAVLICGDANAGLTVLMRSILASAIVLNTPEQISVSVISRQVDDYLDFSKADHCQEILPADEELVGEMIIELAEMVEIRKAGKNAEQAVLLFIDDLAECLDFISEQAYSRLYWLIRHGPRHRVWTFATLPAERANQVGERFLSAFRTRLIGHINDHRAAAELSQDPRLLASSLQSGQFYLPYGSTWIRFWACPADKADQD